MLPLLLVLLMGAGMAALFCLALIALLRPLRRSQAPGPQRVMTGVAGVAGLGCAGVVGAALFITTLCLVGVTCMIERGPIRGVQILRLDDRALTTTPDTLDAALLEYRAATDELDARYPVHVLVEVRGEVRTDRLRRWLERETRGEVELVEVRGVPGAPEHTRLDFGLTLSPREMRRFEREFEEAQPFFDLPHALAFEIREP